MMHEAISVDLVSDEELDVNKIMVHSCGDCMKGFFGIFSIW